MARAAKRAIGRASIFDTGSTAFSRKMTNLVSPFYAMNPTSSIPLPATLAEAHARIVELEQQLARQQTVAAAEAEQRLFYHSILVELPVDVAVFDVAHRYRFINPHAIRSPEIRDWIIGKNDFEYCAYRGFSPERAIVRHTHFERAVAGRCQVAWEEELLQPDGSTRYYLRHFMPVHEASGQLKFVLGYGLEITDRVLAEQQMQEAREVAEMAASARTTFLATMSHEIRTPLNGVLGMAALLAKTPLTPEQREQVGIIHSSGQHLLSVINDVLDVAKITSGKLELERISFDLVESVTRAVAPLAEQARHSALAFETKWLDVGHAWVLGDPFRLNQILLNLLSNALKFTHAGGVTLRISRLAQAAGSFTIEFQVSDTGIGIPADKLEHIFESFSQASAGTTRQFGGTGLGLHISRALVAQLGGQLTVESKLSQGSTFSFVLALPEAEAPVSEVPPQTQEGSLDGLRILLVEDNDINRIIASCLVQDWGAEVDEAPDGEAAIALFEQHRYDIVLMDIQLPDMTGVDITHYMRRHADAQRAQTAILALTASAYQSDMQAYLAAGMNDFISKPFDETVLWSKMMALRPSGSS
jgi:signal transduction histidine kinase/CheY-like chemotaxis protein